MAKVSFEPYDAFNYVEVFEITEWKDGCVYKTKPKGFARADRTKQPNETYSPLSMKILRQPKITLDLLEE